MERIIITSGNSLRTETEQSNNGIPQRPIFVNGPSYYIPFCLKQGQKLI